MPSVNKDKLRFGLQPACPCIHEAFAIALIATDRTFGLASIRVV
jgi:hypothetical protein